MTVIGIDPGTTQSAYVTFSASGRGYTIIYAKKLPNDLFLAFLRNEAQPDEVVIEVLQSYGMPFGKSLIETCYMVGRVIEIAEQRGWSLTRIPRPEYAGAMCKVNGKGSKRDDAALRRALEKLYGGYGKGEPLELLTNTDKRAAFAVAAYKFLKR